MNQRGNNAQSHPRVSVLMSVRNGERFLVEALDSILNQTFTDFEFIVVNDGSTDTTAEILDRYARGDSRLRVLQLAASGLPLALRAGSASLRGEFVARMDADDVAVPDRFARQVDFLDAHPEIALVGGAMAIISEDGRRIGGLRFPEAPEEIAAALQRVNCLAQNTVMLRRAAYESVGGYRPVFPVSEDYDLWARLSDSFLLANLPEELVQYRFHSAQVSGQRLYDECICAAGVRLSARLRRAGANDPFENDKYPVTLQSLLALGAIEREIDEEIAGMYLGRLGALSNVQARIDQFSLLQQVSTFIRSRPHLAGWLPELYRLSGRLQWRQGHRMSALGLVGRAIFADPRRFIRQVAGRVAAVSG